jgi:hypothetical protein
VTLTCDVCAGVPRPPRVPGDYPPKSLDGHFGISVLVEQAVCLLQGVGQLGVTRAGQYQGGRVRR